MRVEIQDAEGNAINTIVVRYIEEANPYLPEGGRAVDITDYTPIWNERATALYNRTIAQLTPAMWERFTAAEQEQIRALELAIIMLRRTGSFPDTVNLAQDGQPANNVAPLSERLFGEDNILIMLKDPISEAN